MDPRNTLFVCMSWLSLPPITNSWLHDSCTAAPARHGSGSSPVATLIQELVKMWTAWEGGIPRLYPPTAKRLQFKLAAADVLSGASGRIFQTDIWPADSWVGEVAFWMRVVRGAYRTVGMLMASVPILPIWYQLSVMVTEVMIPQGVGRGSAVCHW